MGRGCGCGCGCGWVYLGRPQGGRFLHLCSADHTRTQSWSSRETVTALIADVGPQQLAGTRANCASAPRAASDACQRERIGTRATRGAGNQQVCFDQVTTCCKRCAAPAHSFSCALGDSCACAHHLPRALTVFAAACTGNATRLRRALRSFKNAANQPFLEDAQEDVVP